MSRAEELIQKHLDGMLTGEEHAELDLLLARSPEAAEAFAAATRGESALEDAFREEESLAAARDNFKVTRSRRHYPRGEASGARWAVWTAVAACILVLLAFAALAPQPSPVPREVAREPVPLPEPQPTPPPPPPPARPYVTAPAPREAPAAPAPAPEPKPAEATPPVPPPPVPAPPPPPPFAPPPRPTESSVASLVDVKGAVRILGGESKPLSIGQGLLPGQGLQTSGRDARAEILFPDGTRVVLIGETHVAPIAKRMELRQGVLTAEVTKQPAGHPFVFASPHGEATVLGTSLKIVVDATSMRLEVKEGKVRLSRAGRAVDVSTGHSAVAAAGVELVARPVLEEPRFLEIEEFGTARGVKPADGFVRRIFLEPWDTATGSQCVAVPGAGTEIAGDVPLGRGVWFLWVRYRDEPGNTKVSFAAYAGDQLLGSHATLGKSMNWAWKRFTFGSGGGTVRVTLRSTFEGVKGPPDHPRARVSPYGAVNRWDRICLTRDENFIPE